MLFAIGQYANERWWFVGVDAPLLWWPFVYRCVVPLPLPKWIISNSFRCDPIASGCSTASSLAPSIAANWMPSTHLVNWSVINHQHFVDYSSNGTQTFTDATCVGRRGKRNRSQSKSEDNVIPIKSTQPKKWKNISEITRNANELTNADKQKKRKWNKKPKWKTETEPQRIGGATQPTSQTPNQWIVTKWTFFPLTDDVAFFSDWPLRNSNNQLMSPTENEKTQSKTNPIIHFQSHANANPIPIQTNSMKWLNFNTIPIQSQWTTNGNSGPTLTNFAHLDPVSIHLKLELNPIPNNKPTKAGKNAHVKPTTSQFKSSAIM